MRKLADFLKVDATDKLCADIAEACSFENLKKADDSKDFPKTGAFKDLKLSVYRKGKTTDFDLLNSPGIRAIENTSYCSQKMYPTGAYDTRINVLCRHRLQIIQQDESSFQVQS